MEVVSPLYESLKKEYSSHRGSNFTQFFRTLGKMKLPLLRLPQTEDALLLKRDVLEMAVFACAESQRYEEMDRYMAQLRDMYFDRRLSLPKSPREFEVFGLHLVRLLVQNRVADFHSELERIPEDLFSNAFVQYSIQLEQHLMEGVFHRVWKLREHAPSDVFVVMTDMFVETIRGEAAECAESSYQRLPLEYALELLMFSSIDDLLAYGKERGWVVVDGAFVFGESSGDAHHGSARDVIAKTLKYAFEMDRIV
eukprot:TRINITY_DN828_c1_g3_i1.p1 TRINITY_DN828_c1_g3~~TRINITY_DN828_c1_g3_i1.p1  ORF type:complete len:294 (+),score=81.88 TRINITY_DN828_c1_g3_i1:125-883(+)